jgi:hypothetical protein
MALIDLHKDLQRVTALPTGATVSSSQSASSRKPAELTYAEEAVEKELTAAVMKTLVDSNAEVKNMSVTW